MIPADVDFDVFVSEGALVDVWRGPWPGRGRRARVGACTWMVVTDALAREGTGTPQVDTGYGDRT